jgi:hypothetical protein
MRAQRTSDSDAGAERETVAIARLTKARNEQDEERELDRRDSRVPTGVQRDDEAETDVRITGLIPRLTSPSRNHHDLVDIWFGVERQRRTYEWDEAFARVAEGWRPDPRNASHFALFSHPSSSVLIVARQVSSDRAVWREVELEARALVNRVNRAVAEQRTPPVETRRSGGWLLRGRDAAREGEPRGWLSEAIRSLVPKPGLPVSQSSSTGAR